MRADGRPSGSTVASVAAVAFRTAAAASASHRSTIGRGSSGSDSGSVLTAVSGGREASRLGEAHQPERLGSGELPPRALLLGPRRDHLGGVPRAHLGAVLLE